MEFDKLILKANGRIILREEYFALSNRSEVFIYTKCPHIEDLLDALDYKKENMYLFYKDYDIKFKGIEKLTERSLIERLIYLERIWAWKYGTRSHKNPFETSSESD